MCDEGTMDFGGYQTPPASPGNESRLIGRRKKTLQKIESAPTLNNLPPLVNSPIHHNPLSRYTVGGDDSPTELENRLFQKAETSPDTPPHSPSFIRHRGKFLKHSSMPDMQRHLERHKVFPNQGDNVPSPRSSDGSPDLLRKLLRRTTSTGSDDPSGFQSAGSSPLIHRRYNIGTQEAIPTSTNSSPMIRRKSSFTNGVSSLTNSPMPSPMIPRRSVVSRQSSRPDTPVPAPRTSLASNSYTNGYGILVMEEIKSSLKEIGSDQQYLSDDPEHFVEQIRQNSGGELIPRRHPSENSLLGGSRQNSDCIVECNGESDIRETSFDQNVVDEDEGIVIPIRETIDETPEYQKEPETPELRIEKWLVNIEKERCRGREVILPQISSTS